MPCARSELLLVEVYFHFYCVYGIGREVLLAPRVMSEVAKVYAAY